MCGRCFIHKIGYNFVITTYRKKLDITLYFENIFFLLLPACTLETYKITFDLEKWTIPKKILCQKITE